MRERPQDLSLQLPLNLLLEKVDLLLEARLLVLHLHLFYLGQELVSS